MKNKIFILLSFLFLFSCNKKEVKIPDSIIPPDEMAAIFRDIHLTDAVLSRKRLNINKDYLIIEEYYNNIYQKHGYDRIKIDSSLLFYSEHPDFLKNIYEKVIVDLNKTEDTVKIKYATTKK